MTIRHYSELLLKNKELKQKQGKHDYKIAVISNITNNHANDIFEYYFSKNGINTDIIFGDYDNIIQDSEKLQNHSAVFVFWELANLINGLQYKAENMKDHEIEQLISKTKSEINSVVKNLENTPIVIFNKFSSLIFNHKNVFINKFDYICRELNLFLNKIKIPNIFLIDINKIIAETGIDSAVDLRFFYSSKALYSFKFYQNYIKFVLPVFLSFKGKAKKALIFDCDNTLWGGVLGEDGFEDIKMSSAAPGGVYFEEVQELAVALSKKGIIIGLCSKNNKDDVEEVLLKHPDMKLRNEHIIIKKINWNNKVDNLISIANDLNIGTDAIVFVDDSDFEVNLIREHIPDITVLKRPARLPAYPKMIRDKLNLFDTFSKTREDISRINDYHKQAERSKLKDDYVNIEDYLKSLQIEMTVYNNNHKHISRIAQLTQRTNQFNLTTKRYTEAEIIGFIENKNSDVFSVEVNDKFGESGITAVVIIEKDNDKVTINSFLMSCRIIGRNIEYSLMDYVINHLKDQQIKKVEASYLYTRKNEQVKSFYDDLNFELLFDDGIEKRYIIDIKNYVMQNTNYIGVKNGT